MQNFKNKGPGSFRYRTIEDPPTPDATPFLEVSIGYMKAGTNWFYGKEEPGGIYLYFVPMTHEDGFVSQIIGRGNKILLEPRMRDNKKRIAALAELLDGIVPELAKMYDVTRPETTFAIKERAMAVINAAEVKKA